MGSSQVAVERHERPSVLVRLGAVAIVLAIAFVAARYVDLLPVLGRNIPQTRIELDYGIGIVFATLVAASILAWPVPAEDRHHLLWLWLAKCLVTLGFMLAYEWNYGLDAYGYFARSREAAPPADVGFSNGTANMIWMTWWVANVLPSSYHALKVFFALVGLIGVYMFYRAATRFIKRTDPRILYLIGLFPSCLFWSSILGKDPVQLLGIGLYVCGVVSFASERRARHLVTAAAGLILSMFIRLWSGPILILPLVVFALFGVKGVFRRVAIAGVFVAAFGFTVSQVADMFRLETAQDLLNTAERLSQSAGWEGGSAIQSPDNLSSTSALVAFAPAAMLTALFRPLPGELGSFFGMLAGFENGVLLMLLAIAVVRFRRGSLSDPIVYWAILLVLGWSVVYGLSVYNLGSLVRFKLQILPVLLLLLMHLGGFGAIDDRKRADRVSQTSHPGP